MCLLGASVFFTRKLSGVFYPILIHQIHYPSTSVSASVALRRRLILSVMTRHDGGSLSQPFMISLHVWYARYISSNQIIGTGGRRWAFKWRCIPQHLSLPSTFRSCCSSRPRLNRETAGQYIHFSSYTKTVHFFIKMCRFCFMLPGKTIIIFELNPKRKFTYCALLWGYISMSSPWR